MNDIQIYDPKKFKHIAKLKNNLRKRFAIIDLDLCLYYLNIKMQRDRVRETVRVTQITYLKKILTRFNISKYITTLTPMILNTQLQKKLINKASPEVIQEYQSIIKSIIYLIIQIRPNIYYAITILSRYNHNSNIKYIATIKRVLRYLKETLNYRIT